MSLRASSVFRNGLAVVAGMAVGSAVNMGLIVLNSSVLFPMPPDVSFEDKEGFSNYIASLPPLAYVLVFLAHFGQAMIGGYLASYLSSSPEAGKYSCYIVGTLTMVGSIMNTASLPVPLWTWLEIPVYPFLIYFTSQLAKSTSGETKKSD